MTPQIAYFFWSKMEGMIFPHTIVTHIQKLEKKKEKKKKDVLFGYCLLKIFSLNIQII